MNLPRGRHALANIREATIGDIPSIAAVHVASWRESYSGMIDDRLIEERTLDVRLAQWIDIFDQSGRTTLVAQNDAGATVGFASGRSLSPRVDGFDSYLQMLYLIAAAKGRGVGGALLRGLARKLLETGCRTMALRVVRNNPARQFYEGLGAVLSSRTLSIDAGIFDDVVYEFADLQALLER